MIPMMNIIAWGQTVPWTDTRQIEQDLIISRAVVVLFSDPTLIPQLRFRGGTALNKIHFPTPLRYSEDIDLVRTEAGPIGPILDRIRELLAWLGKANFEQSPVAPKLRFRVDAEDPAAEAKIRLKVEINTAETNTYDPPTTVPFHVENPWFSGSADVPTFSHEEILATKLRALLQRDKGRDLFDLAHALEVFKELNAKRLVECFNLYIEKSNTPISRAEAEQRMFAKLRKPRFLDDMKPLVPAASAEQFTEQRTKQAFAAVFSKLIALIPGDAWARTDELMERYEIPRNPSSELGESPAPKSR
jgi:predicted nucleotidyltransferase component of viral defense system